MCFNIISKTIMLHIFLKIQNAYIYKYLTQIIYYTEEIMICNEVIQEL